MSLDTTKIIHACEKMWTDAKRANASALRDDHRDAVMATFAALCTDLGKLTVQFKQPDWMRVQYAIAELHTQAVSDEAARAGTFTQIGSELRLAQALVGLAINLGATLEDAATAPAHDVDDAEAMAAIEGHDVLRAAE